MRHRLVSPGAERFLPFAESCVTKLLKLGLPYASQSFEVDGVSIKVRIEPGHEYIRIEGGSCSSWMDSGVVDLVWVNLGLTDKADGVYWDPIMLYETEMGAAYNAGFTKTLPGTTGDDSRPAYKVNPSMSSRNQIAGLLTYSGSSKSPLKGAIPDGRAKSFAPFVYPQGEDAQVQWIYASQDRAVADKKELVAWAPASIFTGRCRTYVQAMYGAWLYDNPHKQGSLHFPLSKRVVFGVAPRLALDIYRREDDRAVYPEIIITTSSGVYLDEATGKHWLVNPSDTDLVTIYPLRATSCAEKLRAAIKTPTGAQFASLLGDDIDRIESYILAHSLPDPKNAQHLTVLGSKHSPWACGYGWHWNKSGTAADRVINTWYQQGRPEFWNYPPDPEFDPWGVESTHSRLTLNHAKEAEGAEDTFTLEPTTISGPTRWAVNRGAMVILEPSWNYFAPSAKTTKKLSNPFASSATFYAFYANDNLQLCRVTIGETAEIPAEFTSSSEEYAEGVPTGSDDFTVLLHNRSYGLRREFYKKVGKIQRYFTYSFSIGSASHAELVVGRQELGFEQTMSTKTLSPPTSWDDPGTNTKTASWAVMDPYDPDDVSYITLPTIPNDVQEWYNYQQGYDSSVSFRLESYSFVDTIVSKTVVGISGSDAEAVYIQSTKRQSVNRSGFIRSDVSGLANRVTGARRWDGGTAIYYYYLAEVTGGVSDTTIVGEVDEDIQLFKKSQLVCGSAVYECNDDWDLSYTVWSEDEYAMEYFYVLTGAEGSVVLPQKKLKSDAIGFNQDLLVPAIVGYA